MKRLLFISWIFLLSVSFGLTKVKADIRMPLIFGDHMANILFFTEMSTLRMANL